MKKCLMLTFICVIFLAGCTQKQLNLTLYSTTDKQLFATIGENKETIDTRLGTPKKIDDGHCTYTVGDSDIIICYDTNNNACMITCLNSEFSLENGIKTGDDMNSVYKAYKLDELEHKTLLISQKDGKSKIVSENEIDLDDIANIYAINFGVSISSGVVDSITLGNRKTMMIGDYNREIQ